MGSSQRRVYDYENLPPHLDYNKIKVGTKVLDDAVISLGSHKGINRQYSNKAFIMKALYEKNLPVLRDISNYFYRTSGIYSRVCNYFAYLYRYDWYVVPEIKDKKLKEERVLEEFESILDYLDNSHIKRLCGQIALEVIKEGVYYGYLIDSPNGILIQQLPVKYCRSRWFQGTNPVVEFNMRFFDEQFRDTQNRMRVLKMFPKDFQEGYVKYKSGRLETDDLLGRADGHGCWYVLDPQNTVKFSLYGDEMPLFISAIPQLLDLDEAQDLDRRKQMQQLLKILIQKLPRDKNGDLIFDVDEARDIHNNAVEMLSRAVGVDVLTTFADVAVEDIADSNTATTKDDLEKVERSVYNSFGVAKNLFNSDGNLSLQYSILDDESAIRDLLFQFHMLFDRITQKRSGSKRKMVFKFYMLETTQYNYRELSKMYKEQVQIGYSKMLPQIALGHSQSSIIHTAKFENEFLHLSELMLPPMQSSTMNAEGLQTLTGKGGNQQSTQSNSQNKSGNASSGGGEEKAAGRPAKEDGQKSEKTIKNLESMK